MGTRDEYVAKLKKQLDQWNAEISAWEGKARQAGSGMKAEADRHLNALRQSRDEAMESMRRMQSASGDAWKDLVSGADEAAKRLREAFDRARAHFKKERPEK